MSVEFAARVGGADVTLTVDEAGFTVGGGAPSGVTPSGSSSALVDWLDVDDVTYAPHSLTFTLASGSAVTVSHLGKRFDECARTVRELRGAARRPALTQSALAPLAQFEMRTLPGAAARASGTAAGAALPGDTSGAGAEPLVTDVLLFPHVLTIEPRGGPSSTVPLPLVADVVRAGHTFTLRMRGLDDVTVRGLGARTDEFEQRLAEARAGLAAATAAAFGELHPELSALGAPDGWAVDETGAGPLWSLLRDTWLGLARADAAVALAGLADPGGLRLGLWTEGGRVRLPFLLAAIGSGESARVAVEAVDADDRATFVFATDDVDRLNAALVLTAFRREALSLPDTELGRWAVAVRTQPVVRWARSRLVARVVHDAAWLPAVTAALAPPATDRA